MVSEDWVVRYKNHLLQLERQMKHWAPAKSRVVVRENEAGEIAIHYRGQQLRFRELSAAATALSEGRGAAPSPRAPIPETNSGGSQAAPLPCRQSSLEQGWQNMKTPAFSRAW